MSPGRIFAFLPPSIHSVAIVATNGVIDKPEGADCQSSFIFNISSRALARGISSGAQKLIAKPLSPALAVRPIRCI